MGKFPKVLLVLAFVVLGGALGKLQVNNDRNLVIPQYISSLINKMNDKDRSRNHDVALIRLEIRKKSEIFDDIAKKIAKENPHNALLIHEMIKPIEGHHSFVPSFIIVVSDMKNPSNLAQAMSLVFHRNKWPNSVKAIFVPTNLHFYAIPGMLAAFDFIGILNAVVLQQGKVMKIYSANRFARKFYQITRDQNDLDVVFPDKVKDLHGYGYKLALTEQPPRMEKIKGTEAYIGIDLAILNLITKIQNAKVGWFLSTNSDDLMNMLQDRVVDLSLNTIYQDKSDGPLKFINTYDENGFCALIPIPRRLSFLQFLLSPFDLASWILIIVSTLVCAIVWKFLRRPNENNDSALRFVCGIVISFIGQGIEFRNNRKQQVLLLQLCLMMTFILGNCYQSIVISSMATSRDGIRMKTVDEMFSNVDLKFKVDPIFYGIFEKSRESSALIDRMEIGEGIPDYEQLAKTGYSLIARCDMIENEFNVNEKSESWKYFYMLPEKMMPFYEKFPLAPDSPFYDKLKMYHDFVFESGIRQFWRKYLKPKKLAQYQREANYFRNEDYYLKMDDVVGIFYVLIAGLATSVVVFLFEISWVECLRNINVRRIWRRQLRKLTKHRTMRIRKIQVRPIEI